MIGSRNGFFSFGCRRGTPPAPRSRKARCAAARQMRFAHRNRRGAPRRQTSLREAAASFSTLRVLPCRRDHGSFLDVTEALRLQLDRTVPRIWSRMSRSHGRFLESRKCFAARSTGWFFDIVHSTIHPFQLTHANRSRPCLVEEGAEHFRVLDGIPWLDRSRSEARRAARGRQARLNAVIPWLIYGVARDLCVQRRGLSASRQSRLRDSTASGPFSVFRVRGTGGVPRLK